MANQSHGFDVTVGMALETTFGTPGAAYKWPGIVESFEPSETNNIDQRRSIGVRGPFMLRHGAKGVEASVEVALQNARLIYAALGVSTDGGVVGAYTHTIRPAVAGEVLPSFTFQLADANLGTVHNYKGGKVDSLTITAAVEEAVMMSADMIFQGSELSGAAAAAVAAELDNYFMFYEGVLTINGAAATNVTEFEVEIANNLEGRLGLAGSREFSRIEEGNLEITSSLTLDMTNNDQYTAFVVGDEITVVLTLQDVADAAHKMVITLTGGMYDSNDAGVAAEDLREQELELIFRDIEVEVTDAFVSLF